MTDDDLKAIEFWASKAALAGDYAHDAQTENEHRRSVMLLVSETRILRGFVRDLLTVIDDFQSKAMRE